MFEHGLTEADLSYLAAGYFVLAELCAGRVEDPGVVQSEISRNVLPRASYLLDDGTELFPADYFVLADQAGGPPRLRESFEARYRAAGGEAADLEADWQAYVEGTYGVCLRLVSPEAIVRKAQLVASIHRLLEDPDSADPGWRRQLRREVWELDTLERDFAPDYDRTGRFGRPPTRDMLIAAARERHPEVFAVRAGAG